MVAWSAAALQFWLLTAHLMRGGSAPQQLAPAATFLLYWLTTASRNLSYMPSTRCESVRLTLA